MSRPLAPGLALGLVAVLAVLAACASPPPLAPEQIREPPLRAIRDAFAETVRRAHADPDITWRDGWWGNLRVVLGGDDERGLCYEWQGLVYAGVLPTVRRVGWAATGVNVNQGTSSEHHAVVVYDPRRTRRDALLADPEAAAAWVLDAWRRGEPDVFPLAIWLDLPFWVRVEPRLEAPYPGSAGGEAGP